MYRATLAKATQLTIMSKPSHAPQPKAELKLHKVARLWDGPSTSNARLEK